jgi:hypothetical protein
MISSPSPSKRHRSCPSNIASASTTPFN